MKKLLLMLSLLVPLIASAGMTLSPGIGTHTHVDANTGGQLGPLTFVGVAGNSSACLGTGYSNLGFNFCYLNTGMGSLTALTAGTCTTILPTGASDAKQLLVVVEVDPKSNNAIGARFGTVESSDDGINCVTATNRTVAQVQEFVATAAGTILATSTVNMLVPVSGGQPTLKFTRDGGNQSAASFKVIGYWR